jgi:hypothetical protein
MFYSFKKISFYCLLTHPRVLFDCHEIYSRAIYVRKFLLPCSIDRRTNFNAFLQGVESIFILKIFKGWKLLNLQKFRGFQKN